ncbi:hypothetical protein EDB80DRAFT_571329, partial [Ilyonectria destructans]
YSNNLEQLYKALKQKYNLKNISHILYTLAVDIYYTASDQLEAAVYLLADCNRVTIEFYSSNYTFYPLSFHSIFRNFTSNSPPAFLDNNLFTIIKNNISY